MSILDNLKTGMKARSKVQTYAAIAAGIFIIVLAFGIGASFMGGPFGEAAPNTLASANGGAGCYLQNEYFIDTDTVKSSDYVISKLPSNLKSKFNSVDQKNKLDQLITQSGKSGVNPALLVAIWYGEQTFGSPEKAFGYGIFDGSTDRHDGFDDQLTGALKVINDAVKNQGNYTKPKGANIFTRLFYNYTGSMRSTYDKLGYVAGADNSRIIMLNYLVPHQVVCEYKNKGSNDVINIATEEYNKYKDKQLTDSQYAVLYGGKAGLNWCAYFASYVFRKAGYVGADGKPLPVIGSAAELETKFKMINDPKPSDVSAGDLISTKNGSHVGIATGISPNGKTVYTIEGNINGGKLGISKEVLSNVKIGKWEGSKK